MITAPTQFRHAVAVHGRPVNCVGFRHRLTFEENTRRVRERMWIETYAKSDLVIFDRCRVELSDGTSGEYEVFETEERGRVNEEKTYILGVVRTVGA